ncbi:transcription factor NIGT1-like isoform X2 [Phragmites australis]|uniref:transcription factor NIGT1-like isoform X2 n=1 Tax=Phragmites australis TaxID=29695 RepID=UPI002D7A0C05|nr:transcription factor NIGT1-like isoform X2 [Phragmites australis]
MEMYPPPPPLHKAAHRRRCRDYLIALEEERRKIQVFQRELPLCLDLVTQTIEGIRSQMDGVGSVETVSEHGPVLEEFMPLKPSLSLSSSDEEHESTHATAVVTNGVEKKEEADTPDMRSPSPGTKKAMPDWLQSVQLWCQEPPQQPSSLRKELPCKPVALSSRNAGGAFQPFEKEKRAELPASSTTAAASSAVVGDSGDKASIDTEKHSDKEINKDAKDRGKDKDKEGQSQPSNRKPRRCWAPELHRRFLQALQQLGGSHVATPKQIRELMKVDGLTNDEVKSHLQKYRLHTRRPNSTVQSSSASAAPPTPQFVVVGGIWVPPPEYAAAAAAAAVAAQPQVQLAGDASGSANTIYAPVATLTSGLQPHSQLKQQQQQGHRQSSRCSDGQRSVDAGDATSASPAVSSSSQTTSARRPRHLCL